MVNKSGLIFESNTEEKGTNVRKHHLRHKRLIQSHLVRAKKDLSVSAANLYLDPGWAYVMAYQAILNAGYALLVAERTRFEKSLLPKPTIRGLLRSVTINGQYFANTFWIFRRRTWEFLGYLCKKILDVEAIQSLKTAEQFVAEIATRIEKVKGREKLV